MVSKMDISTPIGQQLLYDFVHWRLTGRKPIPGYYGVALHNSCQDIFRNVTISVFRAAAKKIAPIAVGKMPQEDFDMLLCLLEGQNNKQLRKELKKQREENPCDGSEIKAPFPVDRTIIKGADIDKFNVYTKVGRRILLDFIDHKNTGFSPKLHAGSAQHYRSRQEYIDAGTIDQFRWKAKVIARDVMRNVPCREKIAEIFQEAEEEVAQRKKARARRASAGNLDG